jgi:hypothetical protein
MQALASGNSMPAGPALPNAALRVFRSRRLLGGSYATRRNSNSLNFGDAGRRYGRLLRIVPWLIARLLHTRGGRCLCGPDGQGLSATAAASRISNVSVRSRQFSEDTDVVEQRSVRLGRRRMSSLDESRPWRRHDKLGLTRSSLENPSCYLLLLRDPDWF